MEECVTYLLSGMQSSDVRRSPSLRVLVRPMHTVHLHISAPEKTGEFCLRKTL